VHVLTVGQELLRDSTKAEFNGVPQRHTNRDRSYITMLLLLHTKVAASPSCKFPKCHHFIKTPEII
jgi:hypothetical protein